MMVLRVRTVFVLMLGCLSWGGWVWADGPDVAMVTSIQGGVSLGTPQGREAVSSFTKLRHGDLLILDRESQLQVVYFDNGRQETWKGSGRLEIAKADSIPYGLAPPMVKVLPAVVVKQIAKTPTLESQGRTGMLRLRAVGAAADRAGVDANYERLRREAAADDLSPELYLLSALFESRQYERLGKSLDELKQQHAGNPALQPIVETYTQALRSTQSSR